MKYVLRYESPDDIDVEALGRHFPAHRALWASYQDAERCC